MGNLCCANTGEMSPDKLSRIRSFSSFNFGQQKIVRNSNSFDSSYWITRKKLGFGSYGDVKMCSDRYFKTEKAVKIMNKDHLRSLNIDLAWFNTKIDILNRLDHPYIIKFHEYFEDYDFFYLVMDYHSEGDLLRRLKLKPQFTETSVCQIIHQLLISVAYMHSKKIAHRDLKLENILLTVQPEISIKVVDFDTAADFEESRLSGALGTFHYMAPETINKYYSEKCDLWSCGIIMHMLLSGKPNIPGFTRDQSPSKMQKVSVNLSKIKLKNISSEANDLLKKLLQKDPLKRISSTEALYHPWFSQVSSYSYDATFDILEKIVKCRDTPLIRAAKKLVMILNFSFNHLIPIEKAFLHLDTMHFGELTFESFYNFLLKKLDHEEAQRYSDILMEKMNEFDVVRYSDFLELALDEKILIEPNNLKFFFDLLCEPECEILNISVITRKLKYSSNGREEFDTWISYIKSCGKEELDYKDFSQTIKNGLGNNQ